MEEKDSEFKFSLQSFIRDHSSVNGLVDERTVTSVYDMILDHARMYVNVKPDVKMVKGRTRGQVDVLSVEL